MAKVVIIGRIGLSPKKIDRIVRFVTPKHTKLPPIVIKPTSANSKYLINAAYYANDKEVLFKIAKRGEFPFRMELTKKEKSQGYIDGFCLRNKEEALVYWSAHEFRHCWQAQHPKAKRMGRRKNKYSESDADLYALQKLKEWRKRKRN